MVVAGDQAVSTANPSTAIDVSTATMTKLVPLANLEKIYVTAWDVISATTGDFGLKHGTDTTALTGAYNLTAQKGILKGNGAAPVLVVPAGNALCAVTPAAFQMPGAVPHRQS